MNLEEEFEAAKVKVTTLPRKPANEEMLDLYALNKQASIGEINIEPPKMFDFVGTVKYNAWKSKSGLSKEEAMKQYIELVNRLLAG